MAQRVETNPAHRRILAFSLYGDAPIYLRGAVENARLAPIRYPGWTARFYVSQEIPRTLIDEIEAHGAETVAMTRRGTDDGMYWRFLAADEHAAEAAIFRDVDSRLSEREVAAVDEWLSSGKQFHIMRDHPAHRWPIMGGMWGVRPGALAPLNKLIRGWKLRRRFLAYELGMVENDQAFLRAAVYPCARGDAVIHSEFFHFEGEDVRPFPVPAAPGEFVGQIVAADGTPHAAAARQREANHAPIDGGPVRRHDPVARAGRLARRVLTRSKRSA